MTIYFRGLSQNTFTCQCYQIRFYNINICTDNYEVNSKFVCFGFFFSNGPEIRHCNHDK